MNTIKQIQKKAFKIAFDNGWFDKPTTFVECLALIHSELSEALEEYRKGKGPKDEYFSKDGKPEGIPIELADAIIRICTTAEFFGIDLDLAIKKKMKFNKSRPYKHGKVF